MKRRKGHQVEYQGKKYDSLSELSKDLELPYSSIVHIAVVKGGQMKIKTE